MLRWRYVFSNSSGFFSCHLSISALGPNPFTTWFLQVQITGLLPSTADHPVVLVCIISCIKHHTPDTVRNIFDHLSEHRRVVCPPSSNCTGHDLSSLYVGNYVQFDEFTPRDNASLGILPLCIPNYGNPPWRRLAAIRAHRILPAFLLSCAATHNLPL